jgi:hypothetical protein
MRAAVNTGKGKVVAVLNLAPHHEDVWGSGGVASPLLTSTPDGGEWSASRYSRHNSGK